MGGLRKLHIDVGFNGELMFNPNNVTELVGTVVEFSYNPAVSELAFLIVVLYTIELTSDTEPLHRSIILRQAMPAHRKRRRRLRSAFRPHEAGSFGRNFRSHPDEHRPNLVLLRADGQVALSIRHGRLYQRRGRG